MNYSRSEVNLKVAKINLHMINKWLLKLR